MKSPREAADDWAATLDGMTKAIERARAEGLALGLAHEFSDMIGEPFWWETFAEPECAALGVSRETIEGVWARVIRVGKAYDRAVTIKDDE